MSPNSIISLVPSLTELLFDLGLNDNIKGRTRFCIHPKESVEEVPIIGGTKNPRLDKIREIEPDLIIANKEENRREDIEELKRDFEVHITEIGNINEALFTIHDIGWKCGAEEKAKELIHEIQERMKDVPDEKPITAAYMIWRDPWMTVGKDTYIHSVMEHWKLENIFEDKTRYPKTSLEEISYKKPDVILLSSEPYPFKEKHIKEVSQIFKGTSIILVNGEWFSWYGSRMVRAFEQLNVLRRTIV